MSLSATSVALILSIVSTAHGSPAVPGDVREGVPATETSTDVDAGTTPEGEVIAPTPEEQALYSRFFEEEEPKAAPESPVVQETRSKVWPWWVWPVGMLTIGVLLLMRGKARERLLPSQAIRIVSRSALGKDGTLAVIEVADGDHRTRRLLVGFGSGAPRLVADVSAWDVAVAAPALESAAAPHHTGPDPLVAVAAAQVTAPAPEAAAHGFGGSLTAAAARYDAEPPRQAEVRLAPVEQHDDHDDLVAEVLAMRDTKEITPSQNTSRARRPSYSRRQVVA